MSGTLWLRIADTLEAEIASLTSGTELASEHALARRFAASRATVRKALERLEAKHLIRRVQGLGTFVNRRIEYRISSRMAPSLHETVADTGERIHTVPVSVNTAQAPQNVAERLEVTSGEPCIRIERIGYIDNELVTYGQEWVTTGSFSDARERLRIVPSLTELFRANGACPFRAWTRATADFTPGPMNRRLGTDAALPAWKLETLTRDAVDGSVLMFSCSWQRQDRLTLVVEFEASTWSPTRASVH